MKYKKKFIVCKDTGERVLNYNAYLFTDHWETMKDYVRNRYKFKCQLCKKSFKDNVYMLNVHHKTYEHLGREYKSDLTLLCKDCHELVHSDKVKYKKFFR